MSALGVGPSAVYWIPGFGAILQRKSGGEVVMVVSRSPTGSPALRVIVLKPATNRYWWTEPGKVAPEYLFVVDDWDRIA